jgi:glucuronoarabinoxylan endo-1,4-beta-xylanase
MPGGAGMPGSAGTPGSVGVCGGGSASANDAVVTLSDADADTIFSTTRGAGLSLLRIRIAPDGTTTETAIAQKAQARGAAVWATPWSPAAAFKSNNNVIGGTLSNGQGWAASLAKFVTTMSAAGVKITAISAQNEPDATVNYESSSYTGSTLAAFMGTYLGPALAQGGVKLVGPETQNWCNFKNYADSILNDKAAAAAVSIIATHEYGCTPFAYPAAQQAGKEFWETEIYDQSKTTDAGMGSGLAVAKLIHDALTIASVNAWHYWWVYPSSTGNGALWDQASGQPSKRLWVLGNFARFVRPGFQRVGTSGKIPAGVSLTAYKNPTDGTVVVVAINSSTAAAPLSLYLSGQTPCEMTPEVTSATDNLVAKAKLTLSSGHLTAMLGAQSVTTFTSKP